MLYYYYYYYYYYYNTFHSPEKWHFCSLQSLLLPQFSTYRHRTGFIVKRKWVGMPNYLGIPVNEKKKITNF